MDISLAESALSIFVGLPITWPASADDFGDDAVSEVKLMADGFWLGDFKVFDGGMTGDNLGYAGAPFGPGFRTTDWWPDIDDGLRWKQFASCAFGCLRGSGARPEKRVGSGTNLNEAPHMVRVVVREHYVVKMLDTGKLEDCAYQRRAVGSETVVSGIDQQGGTLGVVAGTDDKGGVALPDVDNVDFQIGCEGCRRRDGTNERHGNKHTQQATHGSSGGRVRDLPLAGAYGAWALGDAGRRTGMWDRSSEIETAAVETMPVVCAAAKLSWAVGIHAQGIHRMGR